MKTFQISTKWSIFKIIKGGKDIVFSANHIIWLNVYGQEEKGKSWEADYWTEGSAGFWAQSRKPGQSPQHTNTRNSSCEL